MDEPKQESIDDRKLQIERDKLNLEIAKARRERWLEPVKAFALPFSIAASIWLGINQVNATYRTETLKLEATVRSENQRRIDAERQLLHEREKQRTELEFTARKPFFEKQLALCFEAVGATAEIAYSESGTDRERSSIERFWHLYWGHLGIVEDNEVARQMVSFKDVMARWQGGQSYRACAAGEVNCLQGEAANRVKRELHRDSLSRASLDLAHACRDLIGKSWSLSLPRVTAPARDQPAPK